MKKLIKWEWSQRGRKGTELWRQEELTTMRFEEPDMLVCGPVGGANVWA